MALSRRGSIRANVKLDGADQVKRKSKEIQRAFDDMAKGGRGLDGILRSIGPATGVAVAGIGATIIGMRALVDGARAASRAIGHLVQQGSALSAVSAGFEEITTAGFEERITAATNHFVSSTELMAAANTALRTGLVDENMFADMSRNVAVAAQQMNLDVTAMVQAMTQGIAGGGMEWSVRLGVNLREVQDRLKALGLTAESAAGRLEANRLVAEQLEARYGRTSITSSNLGDSLQRLVNIVGNWITEVGEALVENAELLLFFEELGDVLLESGPDAEEWGNKIAAALQTFIEHTITATRVMLPFVRTATAVLQSLQRINLVLSYLNPAGWANVSTIEAQIEATDAFADGLTDLDNVLDGVVENTALGRGESTEHAAAMALQERAAQATSTALSTTTARTRMLKEETAEAHAELVQMMNELEQLSTMDMPEWLGDVAGPTSAPAAETPEEIQQRQDAAKRRSIDEMARLEREAERRRSAGRRAAATRQREEEHETRERQDVLFEDILGHQAFLEEERQINHDAEMARNDEIKEFELAQHEKRLEREEELREIGDARKEALFELAEKEAEVEAATQERRWNAFNGALDTTRNAIGVVGGALGDAISLQEENLANMQAGMEAAGMSHEEALKATEEEAKSIERLKKAEGALLIAENVVAAIQSGAEAARLFAQQDYVGGALATVAAIGHGVAAATAAARMGGGSASVPSAPTAGTFVESKPEESEEADTGAEGFIINNQYNLARDMGDLGRAIDQATWQKNKSGRPSGMPMGMEYL